MCSCPSLAQPRQVHFRGNQFSFPVLSLIKPQAPLLVVPFHQFLKISVEKELLICQTPSSLQREPVKFSRVEPNQAAGSTPGGALPSIPLSFSRERAINLSTLAMSGPGKFSRVESK